MLKSGAANAAPAVAVPTPLASLIDKFSAWESLPLWPVHHVSHTMYYCKSAQIRKDFSWLCAIFRRSKTWKLKKKVLQKDAVVQDGSDPQDFFLFIFVMQILQSRNHKNHEYSPGSIHISLAKLTVIACSTVNFTHCMSGVIGEVLHGSYGQWLYY